MRLSELVGGANRRSFGDEQVLALVRAAGVLSLDETYVVVAGLWKPASAPTSWVVPARWAGSRDAQLRCPAGGPNQTASRGNRTTVKEGSPCCWGAALFASQRKIGVLMRCDGAVDTAGPVTDAVGLVSG